MPLIFVWGVFRLDTFRVIGSPKGGDPHGDPILRRGEAKHGDVHRIGLIVTKPNDAALHA